MARNRDSGSVDEAGFVTLMESGRSYLEQR
jgi:hypothetical protein